MITRTHAGTHTHTPDRWRDNGGGVFFSVRFGGGGTLPPSLKPEAKERKMDSGDEEVGAGLLTCVEVEEVGGRWCEMAAEMKDVDKRDDS